jgi:HEAT repeat protein
VNDEVLKAMKPLADDRDDDIRMNAIRCMATNQDVAAIPKIAAWHYSDPQTSGNPLPGELENFKNAAAIPFLNALLQDKDQYVRQNAVGALRRLPPDKSSIPYLIPLLRETQNSGVTALDAYYALCNAIPELKPARMPTFGRPIGAEEIQRFETWWADEQAGKHG